MGFVLSMYLKKQFYGIHHLYHSCILQSNNQSQKTTTKIHSNSQFLIYVVVHICPAVLHDTLYKNYGKNNSSKLSTQ